MMMIGHKSAATRAGRSSPPFAQFVENNDDQEDDDDDHEREFVDQNDEQLMNGEEEEEEDDGSEECHYLIGQNSGGGCGAAQVSKHQLSSSSGGKQSPNGFSNTRISGTGGDMDLTSTRTNLFRRLAGYLGAAASTKNEHITNFDDISTSDFNFESRRTGSSNINGGNRQQQPDRLPAYYYEDDDHDDDDHHYNNQRAVSSSASSRSHQTTTRHLLMIFMFLLLIVSTCALLMRLLALLQDEHGRLDVGAPSSSTSSRVRQDSVLSELSRKLDESHRRQLESERLSRWLVSSSKCHIPALDAWHESIREYVSTKPPLDCAKVIQDYLNEDEEEDEDDKNKKKSRRKKKKNKLTMNTQTLSYVQDNRLFFTAKALELGALTPLPPPPPVAILRQPPAAAGQLQATCCFRRVTRTIESDDSLEYTDECVPILQQGLPINSSIIELRCPALNYTNVHAFSVHNDEEEGALRRVAATKLNATDHYNVLMVGVDTISRLNGARQLKKTLALLRERYETLEFVGYNKVGENTFPNLIPLLTGLKPEQLTKEIGCWQAKNYTQENERGDDYLDNCKYLWNYYQQVGYLTYFSEDWPAASTFNYLKPGFKNEPTTFYGRPYTLARDPLLFPKFKSIGCQSCQLDRPVVELDLANLRSFIEGSRSLPYFAFHWINCPQHDDLNGASQVDAFLEKFFANLHDQVLTSGQDRTFVIFFSDHGYRWNDFVSTRIGHYESSLPLLTIAAPPQFRTQHPELYEHLKSHQNALITPFDMFKTLIDLRNLGSSREFLNKDKISRDTAEALRHERQVPAGSTLSLLATGSSEQQVAAAATSAVTTAGEPPTATTSIAEVKLQDGTSFKQKFKTLSLFDEHTSQQLDRSCIDAGIPDNYCVCQAFEPIDANATEVLGAAYYLVYVHLESRLRNHLQLCHTLELERVHHAEVYDFERAPGSKLKTSNRRRRRRQTLVNELKIKTSPAPTAATNETISASKLLESKHNYLPNREYSVMFSTTPGSGLFQEVVRFYGDSMERCEAEIERTRSVVRDEWAAYEDKLASVRSMNGVCEFSVHSESLSRFNLYKDQSKCVTSNIELKKICYCNDLIKGGQ